MPIQALLILGVTVGLAIAATAGRASAQAPPAPVAGEALPDKVRELLALMDDPSVRGWLARQEAAGPQARSSAGESLPAGITAPVMADITAPAMMVRQHILASLAAVPTARAELARAGTTLYRGLAAQGIWTAFLPMAAFLGLGVLVERLYWYLTRGFRQRIVSLPLDTVQARLAAVGRRLAFGLGWVAAFAAGSLGAFLLFDWPPLLHELIARCLFLSTLVWLTSVLVRFILAPGGPRFRILPVASAAAWHWYRWLPLIIGWYAAARLTVGFLGDLGVSEPVRGLCADLLSLAWLVILLLAVWRRPALRAAENPDPAKRAAARTRNWLISLGLLLLWLLVPLGAYRLFNTALVALALPALLHFTRASVTHVLRPPGSDTAETVPPLTAVLLERGLRTLWIAGAAVLVGWIWEVNVNAMSGDATVARILRGVLNAAVILLVIDLLWHLSRTWIDRKLARTQGSDAGHANPEAAHKSARLRTLLPIARNVLLAVLAVMGVLMALTAVGIQVGPLIAGAGVVGVAIGFGSQTLVKDIISGVFFLLDDAFRVGEYIESGSIRGTVESFSLRSIKLRHHRGYLHTVPFGSLEKITNYSRDWVIDKITLGVTYDTDLDLVKRLIKQIGKGLQADPELAPHILETLKMQGVEEYSDYAIKLRFKMMTRPGEQFVIRRRAYALIKKAFDENGVQFAFPTVQVAGAEAGNVAAAQTAIDATKPAAA